LGLAHSRLTGTPSRTHHRREEIWKEKRYRPEPAKGFGERSEHIHQWPSRYTLWYRTLLQKRFNQAV